MGYQCGTKPDACHSALGLMILLGMGAGLAFCAWLIIGILTKG